MVDALENAEECFLFFPLSLSLQALACDVPFAGEVGVVSRLVGISYISLSLAPEAVPKTLWVGFATDRAGCIVVMRQGVLRLRSAALVGCDVYTI